VYQPALKVIAVLAFLVGPVAGQVNNPVTVTLLQPANGATVSGPVALSAAASSTMGPIVKVEFYRDGVLIGTVTNPHTAIPAPSGLKVRVSENFTP